MNAEDGRSPRPGAAPASWPDPSLGGRPEVTGPCDVCGEPCEPETVPYCPACQARTPAQRVAHSARLISARMAARWGARAVLPTEVGADPER